MECEREKTRDSDYVKPLTRSKMISNERRYHEKLLEKESPAITALRHIEGEADGGGGRSGKGLGSRMRGGGGVQILKEGTSSGRGGSSSVIARRIGSFRRIEQKGDFEEGSTREAGGQVAGGGGLHGLESALKSPTRGPAKPGKVSCNGELLNGSKKGRKRTSKFR